MMHISISFMHGAYYCLDHYLLLYNYNANIQKHVLRSFFTCMLIIARVSAFYPAFIICFIILEIICFIITILVSQLFICFIILKVMLIILGQVGHY